MDALVIVDLFAGGPAGWDLGARSLGLDPVGIERWPVACATRANLGLRTICADVATYPAERFAGLEGLIASPPCPDWSRAGKRSTVNGASGQLVAEVVRWAVLARPTWIAAEQVDMVLPVWRAFAGELRRLGYRCWAGLLDAADYGVPQNRIRAFLLAHAGGQPHPPPPTHAERPVVDLAGLTLDPWVSMAEALDWVGVLDRRQSPEAGVPLVHSGDRPSPTVTAAAGGKSLWRMSTGGRSWKHGRGPEFAEPYERDVDRPSPTVVANTDRWKLRTNHRTGNERGTRYERDLDRPAPVVDGETSRWRLQTGGHSNAPGRPQLSRSIDRPAPTVAFGHAEADWVFYRPATTVSGDARVFRPGRHADAEDVDQLPGRSDGAIPLSLEQALVLQGFPPDLPVAGDTKRARHLQVGNAVPPPMAAAVLRAVMAAGPPDARPLDAAGPWQSYLPDLARFAPPPPVPQLDATPPSLFDA